MSDMFLKTSDVNNEEVFLPIQNIFVEIDGTVQLISVSQIKAFEFEE